MSIVRNTKRRVVAFGVFDLLHPGHIAFLTAARALGDELVVVVTRDKRVRAEKGKQPVFNERERLQMLTALRVVDRAVLGDPPGKWHVLKTVRPTIVAVGHDQQIPPQQKNTYTYVVIGARARARYSSSRLRRAVETFFSS